MKDIIRHSTQLTNEGEIEKIWESGKDRQEVPYPYEFLNIPKHLPKTIKKLSKDYNLGIVTSRGRDNVFEIPQISTLQKYFNVLVGYQDTDNHKPHPEPLILAAEKLGVQTYECVYIGDSKSDILAARAAGMKSVLYHKENIHNADANFSFFEELSGIIESI